MDDDGRGKAEPLCSCVARVYQAGGGGGVCGVDGGGGDGCGGGGDGCGGGGGWSYLAVTASQIQHQLDSTLSSKVLRTLGG